MKLTKESLRNFIDEYPISISPMTDELYMEAEIEAIKQVLNDLDYKFLFKEDSVLDLETLSDFIKEYPLICHYYSNVRAQRLYIETVKEVLMNLRYQFLLDELDKREQEAFSF